MRDLHQQTFLVPKREERKKKQPLLLICLILVGVGFLLSFARKGMISLVGQTKTYEFSVYQENKKESKTIEEEGANTTPSFKQTKESALQEVKAKTSGKQGTYGWFVQSLKSGEVYGDNVDFSFTAASVNKVPIMTKYLLEVEKGNMDLDDIYSLKPGDIEEGTGTLQYQKKGTKYSFRELVSLAGKLSDNTAANALASKVGLSSIQALVDSQGMVNTNMVKNTTSPKDMGSFFVSLYLDRLIKTPDLKNLLFDSLTNTEFEDRIAAGVPSGTVVVHKIGNQIQVWNDCGLVLGKNPYALCILTDGIRESEAKEILPGISKIIWEFESRRED